MALNYRMKCEIVLFKKTIGHVVGWSGWFVSADDGRKKVYGKRCMRNKDVFFFHISKRTVSFRHPSILPFGQPVQSCHDSQDHYDLSTYGPNSSGAQHTDRIPTRRGLRVRVMRYCVNAQARQHSYVTVVHDFQFHVVSRPCCSVCYNNRTSSIFELSLTVEQRSTNATSRWNYRNTLVVSMTDRSCGIIRAVKKSQKVVLDVQHRKCEYCKFSAIPDHRIVNGKSCTQQLRDVWYCTRKCIDTIADKALGGSEHRRN